MITKNYIKMCEEAREIQSAWKPKDWDRFMYFDSKEMGIACVDKKGPTKAELKENLMYRFWLPTQEQLWEKIWELEKTCTFDHSFNISQYDKNIIGLVVNGNDGYSYEYFMDTIQECLLVYIYEKGYNKVWTDKIWKEIVK